MRLQFFKLDGAGNDFVALDWRGRPEPPAEELAALARLLCDRHHGVGADGVLLLRESRRADFRMTYLNSDGSVGAMCGNGARCVARFALHRGAAAPTMVFETDAGLHHAEAREGLIHLQMPDVEALPERRHPAASVPEGAPVHFLLVGVPHAVVVLQDLAAADVHGAGRALRRDPAFAPAGTNVNFCTAGPDGSVALRTYERGVEAETLACGTGSVATACVQAWLQGRQGRCEYRIVPTGGIPLQVHFEAHAGGFRQVVLAGPAFVRFEGHCQVDLATREVEVP